MPTLHLRAVPSELMARLKSSARDSDTPIDEHAIALLEAALTAREARREGGRKRTDAMSDDDRRALAKRAAEARWAKTAVR